MQEGLLDGAVDEIARLAGRHAVGLAGPGASHALELATGGWLVDGPPMEAAAHVDVVVDR